MIYYNRFALTLYAVPISYSIQKYLTGKIWIKQLTISFDYVVVKFFQNFFHFFSFEIQIHNWFRPRKTLIFPKTQNVGVR
jgi:hypothetical protein